MRLSNIVSSRRFGTNVPYPFFFAQRLRQSVMLFEITVNGALVGIRYFLRYQTAEVYRFSVARSGKYHYFVRAESDSRSVCRGYILLSKIDEFVKYRYGIAFTVFFGDEIGRLELNASFGGQRLIYQFGLLFRAHKREVSAHFLGRYFFDETSSYLDSDIYERCRSICRGGHGHRHAVGKVSRA